MLLRDQLAKVVKDQNANLLQDIGIPRELNVDINPGFASIITGVRRCGKSTLLKQYIKKMKHYFITFEDIRLADFALEDFSKLNDVFLDLYGKGGTYFFDEIQNVDRWEIFVRSLLDRKKSVVITGSNSKLLSSELGSRLTGRNLRYELKPFSYREFIRLKKKKPCASTFEEYLFSGGFPEYLRLSKVQVLSDLLEDILSRDIMIRHKLRNYKLVREMLTFLLTNTGKEVSFNSISKIFSVGSVNTIIDIITYFEETYLTSLVPVFSFSIKKQLVNNKKIYCADNGLIVNNSFQFSNNRGRLLENLVFNNLDGEIYYFKDCDFVVKRGTRIIEAIQVCYDLNTDNKKREIDGLLKAMQEYNAPGLILTFNQEDEVKISGKKIEIKPVWKWLS